MIARNLVHYALNLLAACGLHHVPGWLDGISAPGAPFLSFSFVAPAVLLALALVLCLGVKESARANNVLTGLKMAIVVFIVAVGLAHLDPGNLVPFAPTGVGRPDVPSRLVVSCAPGRSERWKAPSRRPSSAASGCDGTAS